MKQEKRRIEMFLKISEFKKAMKSALKTSSGLILSILVDTFSSRILNPMLLPSGKRNIVVF